MTAPDISPQYNVAAVEALLLEIATELDPEHLSKDKLSLRVVTNPDDSREIDTAARAIRNLQEVGLFKDREDEVVQPTPAAIRACTLLT